MRPAQLLFVLACSFVLGSVACTGAQVGDPPAVADPQAPAATATGDAPTPPHPAPGTLQQPDADVDGSAPAVVDLGPAGDFRAYADAVAAALQKQYDPSTGLFPSTGWWNSANAITALAQYSKATGSTAYLADFGTTFDKNRAKNFLNDYYDDEGWWALAWLDVYDVTHDARYLAMAKTIFADMTGGWDATTCGGGLWWSKAKSYKNAIANELFLAVAVRLHQRTPTEGAEAGGYLDWAKRAWAWFDASGMIGADGLVNDGLDGACKNNKGTTWTYNQGVLVGGLVELAAVVGDPALVARAGTIAHAAISKLANGSGVVGEPCGSGCGGPDVPQFKGVLMRHLATFHGATGDAAVRAFLATNADWIWNAARGAGDQIGLLWSGPFDTGDAARQAAALDALNAAIAFAAKVDNALLHKSATASAACAADQGAEKAFDGVSATKWCAGASGGAGPAPYWLALDVGASAQLGRVIVRHAGAGGEKQAWNTKDFRIETSADGATWSTVATVTGNTLPVTIHRFSAVNAAHVRVAITAAQTDPQTVAARIYEVEAYAR
jgi:predicted alpha-1,6-mannanase (GH76 family)